jgi:hypothetical protein
VTWGEPSRFKVAREASTGRAMSARAFGERTSAMEVSYFVSFGD